MFGSILKRIAGIQKNDVTLDEVRSASQTGSAHLVDVREAPEFRSGHIPGSVNMPLSRFDAADLPRDKPVILICLSGARSARALGQCPDSKANQFRHFRAGVAGWRASGETLVT